MIFFGKRKKLEEENTELRQKISELGGLSILEIENKRKETEEDFQKQQLEGNKNIEKLNKEKENIISKIEELKFEQKTLIQQIATYKDDLSFVDVGITPTNFEFEKSESYKFELDILRQRQKEMIKSEEAVIITEDFHFNNSTAKGKSFLKKIAKLMLRAFNFECDNAVYSVTHTNYTNKSKAILKSFEQINSLAYNGLVKINYEYLRLKKQELELANKYKLKLQEEKEILREERERAKEEKKAQQEIEAKKQKIDKEINKLNIAKDKVENKLLTTTDSEEIIKLKEELEKLRNEINAFNDEKEDLDYRLQNTGAGYVYIISNIGSFGENIYKIGVTRRLDPYERIYELSNASIPFKFDVHAMIFSKQTFDLETELHKHFDTKRVNKINNRKEFFNISLEDIKEVLNQHKELTFDYNPLAEALEYKQTLKMQENQGECIR